MLPSLPSLPGGPGGPGGPAGHLALTTVKQNLKQFKVDKPHFLNEVLCMYFSTWQSNNKITSHRKSARRPAFYMLIRTHEAQ